MHINQSTRYLIHRAIAILLTVLVTGRAAAQQSTPRADSAVKLFRTLHGRWSCDGGFARGGSLSADLSFTISPDERALSFEHADRPPNVYWQRSVWALDPADHIVSVGAGGSTKDRTATPTFFVAPTWGTNSITLVADTIKAPPFAPNRFTFTTTAGSALKMVWEVARNGAWAVGDSLLCARKS